MSDDAPSRALDKFVVRFPAGMRERIAAAAEAAGRSMNAEIVYRLEGSFSPTLDDVLANMKLATSVFEAAPGTKTHYVHGVLGEARDKVRAAKDATQRAMEINEALEDAIKRIREAMAGPATKSERVRK